jgi:hypothetical protein
MFSMGLARVAQRTLERSPGLKQRRTMNKLRCQPGCLWRSSDILWLRRYWLALQQLRARFRV